MTKKIHNLQTIYSKFTSFFFILLITFAGFISYHNSFSGPFIFDDIVEIVNNPLIREINSFSKILFKHRFRFIPYLSFSANYFFHQYQVFGYHLINFIFHLFTSCFVFWLTRLLLGLVNTKKVLLGKYKSLIPFFTALIFVVHPIQTQAVTYISQRITIFASFFYLLTLIFFINTIKKNVVYFVFTFLFFILAILSKEISFSLPLMIMLLSILFFNTKKYQKKVYLLIGFCLLLTTAIFFVSIAHEGYKIYEIIPRTKSSATGNAILRSEYLITQILVVKTYILLLLFPISQNLDYYYPVIKSVFNINVLFSLIFHLFAFLTAYYFKKRFKIITFGILFFYTALLIESSIIPLADVINEHRLYLPSVGFILAFVSLLFYSFSKLSKSSIINRKYKKAIYYAPVVISILIVSAFSFKTIQRNKIWQDELMLWQDTVKKSPLKVRPRIAFGVSLMNKNILDKAEQELLRAIELNNKHAALVSNNNNLEKSNVNIRIHLANLYLKQEKDEKALEEYEKIFKVYPDNEEIILKIILINAKSGNYQKAVEYQEKLIKLEPENAIHYYNLAVLYLKQNKKQEAEKMFKKVLEIDPEFAKDIKR